MSLPPGQPAEPASFDEHVRYGRVLLIGGLSLLTFGVAVWWSTQILRTTERQVAPQGDMALPLPADTYEVGLVNVQPFAQDTRPERKQAALRRRLSSYGWVDRKKGLIHVPVETVMEEMAKEAQP